MSGNILCFPVSNLRSDLNQTAGVASEAHEYPVAARIGRSQQASNQVLIRRHHFEASTQRSYQIAGDNQVNVIGGISNPAINSFTANIISLPLRSEHNPQGIYCESELHAIMSLIATCIFQVADCDPAATFPMHQADWTPTRQLCQLVERNVRFVDVSEFIANLTGKLHEHDDPTDQSVRLLQTLLQNDSFTVADIGLDRVSPAAAAMVAIQSLLFYQCLGFYPSEDGQVYLPEICRLARLDTPEADETLLQQ